MSSFDDLLRGDWDFSLRMHSIEEGACLGDEDLGLTVVEVDCKFAALNNDAVGSEEDVADSLSLTEAGVRNIYMNLTIDIVSQGNKEGTASVGVEGVINPFLSERIVDDALSLTSFVDCLGELEDIVSAIEVAPHDFSVVGIVTTSEALLTTIVEEGDTSGSQRESKGSFEHSLVSVSIEEASVVMVVNEETKGVNVTEVLAVGSPSVGDGAHCLPIHPDVSDSVVHRIVEESCEIVLVVSNVSIVSVEGFTHLENTRGSIELFPEILGDLGNSINTDTIKSELGH